MNPNKSIKDNILRILIVPTVISLLSSAALLIILFVITSEVAISSARDALVSQITSQSETLSYESSLLLNGRLLRSLQGAVSPIAFALSDATRLGYSQGYIPSFYDFTPKAPLVPDFRHYTPVSFGASTYYFPGSTEFEVFSTGQMESVNESVCLDNHFPVIYDNYEYLMQSYVGYESNGLFRRYPGNFTEDRSYDPRQRGWYGAAGAKKYYDIDYIVTEPYQDFNVLDWMITVAQSIYDDDGTFMGVAGADLLIDNLKQIVDDVYILDTGKVSIFQTDGIVVADPEWTIDKTDPVGYVYQDLVAPAISSDTWDKITETTVGETSPHEFTDNEKDWIVITTHLGSFDEQYLVSVFLNKAEITDPIQPTIDELYGSRNETIGISIGIAVFVTGVVIAIIYCSARQITKPFDIMESNFDAVVEHFGQPPVEGDIELTELSGSGLGREQQELYDAQNAWVRDYNTRRQHSTHTMDNYFATDDALLVAPLQTASVDTSIPMATVDTGIPTASASAYPPQRVLEINPETKKH